MNQEMIKCLGEKLIKENNLPGWSFQLTRAKTQLGVCRHGSKTIGVSLPLAKLNPGMVREVILHEIAHALAGRKHGHDTKWRQIAYQVGAVPQRTNHEATPISPEWIGECPSCHRKITRHRKRNIACGVCCNGKYDARFRFTWRRSQ